MDACKTGHDATPGRRRLATALLAALFAAPVAQAQTQAAVPSSPALVAAAQAEGALNVYYCDTSMNGTVADFQKLYPGIKVTTYVAGCWQIYARYARERAAHRPIADVLMATEDVLDKLQSENSLADYESPQRAAFPDWARRPGRRYTGVKTLILGVTASQSGGSVPVPKDWMDFADPPAAWKDQVVLVDPRVSSTSYMLLAALYQDLGPDKTAQIYKGLAETGVEMAPDGSAALAKLLTGEKAVSFFVLNNHYVEVVAKGAQLPFNVPTSGTLSVPFSIAITSDAPRPDAAKLFDDYMLREGQDNLAKIGEYALRNGSPPPPGLPRLADVKLLPLDMTKAAADQKTLLGWWQNVMGIH